MAGFKKFAKTLGKLTGSLAKNERKEKEEKGGEAGSPANKEEETADATDNTKEAEVTSDTASDKTVRVADNASDHSSSAATITATVAAEPRALLRPRDLLAPIASTLPHISGLTPVHYGCLNRHRDMRHSPGRGTNPVGCMACRREDLGAWWRCTWCYLKVCQECWQALGKMKGDLGALVEEQGQGVGNKEK